MSFFEKYFQIVSKCILWDAVNQLSHLNASSRSEIPTNINENPSSNTTKTVPLHLRFQQEMQEQKFDEFLIRPVNEASQKIINMKLKNDIASMIKVLQETLHENDDASHADDINVNLWQHIEHELCNLRDENQLIMQFEKNKRLFKETMSKLKAAQDVRKMNNQCLGNRLVDMRSSIQDCHIQNSMKLEFIHKWNSIKHKQAVEILCENELEMKCSIDAHEIKIQNEQRAITEIENFMNLHIQELNEAIAFWTESCETSSKRLDLEIFILENDLAKLTGRMDNMNAVFRERKQAIDDYTVELKRREDIRQHQALQLNSAIRIQAWWRGTMVRRQLGPFKVKKKSKKDKKGGKK